MLKPDFAQPHYNLGLALKALGEYDAAIHQYQQALHWQPDCADALCAGKVLCDLGTVLAACGKGHEATVCFKQALEIRPEYAPAHFNLGAVYEGQQRRQDAIDHYRQAVRFNANYFEAHGRLGTALAEENDLEGAAACFGEALRLDPNNGETRRHLGMARLQQGLAKEAIGHFRRAIELEPDSALARVGLANALAEEQLWEEAEATFQQLLREKPPVVQRAHNGRGVTLLHQGRLDEALACFDEALKCNDADADTHLNRALLRLLRGNWAEGWPEAEWRLKTTKHKQVGPSLPRWDGSPLAGKTLLVQTEQGLGDTIHFIRYVPLIEKDGGTLIVECQPSLVNLLACVKEIDRLVPLGTPLKDVDVQVPLMSLPWIMDTSLANLPAKVPYLHADSRLVQQWQQELKAMPGFKVGIAWQGRPTFIQDRQRSIPLVQWKPLAEVEGVQLISLQKGPGSEQLRGLAGAFKVVDLGARLDQTTGAFMDTAAVMKSLDLVITSDTAVAHLAGSGSARVGGAVVCPGLAVAARAHGQPVVSNHEALSAKTGGELGGCLCRHGERAWQCGSGGGGRCVLAALRVREGVNAFRRVVWGGLNE